MSHFYSSAISLEDIKKKAIPSFRYLYNWRNWKSMRDRKRSHVNVISRSSRRKAILINQAHSVEVSKVNLKRSYDPSSRRHKFHALPLFFVWANISTRNMHRMCTRRSLRARSNASPGRIVYAKRSRVYSATITRSATQVSRRNGRAKSIRSVFSPVHAIFMHVRVYSNRAPVRIEFRDSVWSTRRERERAGGKKTEKNALPARTSLWRALNDVYTHCIVT